MKNNKIIKYLFNEKTKGGLKHSIIIGNEGGFYALLNSLNSKDENFIIK